MKKISVSKKQGHFLNEIINLWSEDELINRQTHDRLKESVDIRPFAWKKLAKYSFWISISCIVASVAAMFADEWFVELIRKLFTAEDMAVCVIFAVIAVGLYCWAFRIKKKHPDRVFSSEFIITLGVLSTAVSIAFLGRAINTGSGHFSVLLLLSFIIYGIIGLWFPSRLVWVFSLLSLGGWFGAETGYVSGWGSYYLGMNYPLRFVLFGTALTGLSFLFARIPKLAFFRGTTYKMGLLYLFITLWIISIFGNYGDIDVWLDVSQASLLWWSILFGAVALAAILYGLKYDDYTSRSFGITFLFLNLYTRFFEYFWDDTNKAIFFGILAISFWLIGKQAEKIWNLEFLRNFRRIGEE